MALQEKILLDIGIGRKMVMVMNTEVLELEEKELIQQICLI